MANNSLCETYLSGRSNLIDGAWQYGDCLPLCVQGGLMGYAINAQSQATDDDYALLGKFGGQLPGNFFAIRGDIPAADDSYFGKLFIRV
jgi:hypothetical protein